MTIIPIPEFAPDQPDVPSINSDVVYNVVPTTAVSYGPLPSHEAFSDALDDRCQGAIAARDNSGTVRVYAGDATKLYRLESPGTTPADVSQVGGYNTSSLQPWSFTIHGQRVIATNFNDKPQGFLEGTDSAFGDLIISGETSIKAKFATIIKDWLFLGYTTDATYGDQPQRCWWSAVKDPTNFPTPGTQAAANNLSDFQDQPGDHGALMGIVGNLGTSNGATFFERGVWRIIYTGLPDIFDFIPAEGARGLLASGGLNKAGNRVAYPTEDGFYRFDGSNSEPIGKGKIDKFFYDDVDAAYLDRMSSCYDPRRGLQIWAYAGVGNNNGSLNRLLMFSEAFNRWTATEADALQIECLLRGATFGKTLEDLDSFGTIDSLAFSLDSSVWSGNRSALAAFNSEHKYGYFDGLNLPARIDTPDLEIEAGRQTVLKRARPLIDSSLATLSSAGRDKISDSLSFSLAQAQESNGSVPLRSRGRYHRIRMQTASGEQWDKFSGIDVEDAAVVGGQGKR